MEQKLEQGLKRWAASGNPTLDLEGYVQQRLAREAGQGQPAEPAVTDVWRTGKARRWLRWLGAAAAAAGLYVGANATFPLWANAAADLPWVGPVVQEVIMKDVGLKWAYDAGLINDARAEVSVGGVTVKVLGVVADLSRTTLLYQVTGYDETGSVDKAVRAGEEPPQRAPQPAVFIHSIGGKGAASSSSFATGKTTYGYFGITTAEPLPTETATMTLSIEIGGQRSEVSLQVSREASSRLSTEVPVNQTVTKNGVSLNVHSVIYTPVETVVKYDLDHPSFYGSSYLNGRDGNSSLQVAGELHRPSGANGMSGTALVNFPATARGGTFSIPRVVVGRELEVTWPLQKGATQQVLATSVTVSDVSSSGGRLNVRWTYPGTGSNLAGLGGFALVGSNGEVLDLEPTNYSTSVGYDPDTRVAHGGVHVETLPPGFEPVAVRISQVGVITEGPWTVELPSK